MPKKRGTKGGKKAQAARAKKEERLAALKNISPSSFTGFAYSTVLFACGCRVIDHIKPDLPPLYQAKIAKGLPSHGEVSDKPTVPYKGCHYEAEFYYANTEVRDEQCEGCNHSINTVFYKDDQTIENFYNFIYRRPRVSVKTVYRCGHSRREVDQQYFGYAPFRTPWDWKTNEETGEKEFKKKFITASSEKPGVARIGLAEGVHEEAEFHFENVNHEGMCLDCIEWMGRHFSQCGDCAIELIWTAIELENKSLGRW